MPDYISVQTSFAFPLASVKPLDGLQSYRAHCLSATRSILHEPLRRRQRCSACGSGLKSLGNVANLGYVECPSCNSIFLHLIPASSSWADLLADVSHYRRSPEAFHRGITQSRSENVYGPKIEWVQSTLRLQDVREPRLMEVVTPPSDFTSLLQSSGSFTEILTVDEMDLVMAGTSGQSLERKQPHSSDGENLVDVAVLLESLDRVDDPTALLRAVARRLAEGGLLFVTALVCSGFDMRVLGLRNLYLYPPDRANCFSLRGLERLLKESGFTLLEVSTPGVLDLEIVQAHLRHDPSIPLSTFERELLATQAETHAAFQEFLQQHKMSSFARIVGKKQP